MKSNKVLFILWISLLLSVALFGLGVKMNILYYSLLGLLGILISLIGILIQKLEN